MGQGLQESAKNPKTFNAGQEKAGQINQGPSLRDNARLRVFEIEGGGRERKKVYESKSRSNNSADLDMVSA